MIETPKPLAGWVAPPPPGRMVLEGRHVRLEALTEAHAAALHEANSSAANWAYLPYGPYARQEDYAAWVSEVSRHPDPLFFAICARGSGRPVGVASYLRIAPAAGSIEVGHIHFSPALQGTVGATETMALMMAWAFRAGYRRYEWKCDAANRPSRRAAQRLGLSYEGIFRQAGVVKGRNRDTAWFAAIDAEWPALEAAFETWLAPENFDAEGRQRQSLSALTRPILVARDPEAE
ncbi:MAG: GNAT family protein [Pseudomonadota bacterium]